MDNKKDIFDIFIIGGGINGVAIARDAAGRGLSVVLAEKGDLASETSSKSTNLIHGGLRYLEYFDFKLVRNALQEREVLLQNMPHIAKQLRLILPISPDMRFESETPAGRLLGIFMPWLKGKRPGWIIRIGLWLYDHLGGNSKFPSTTSIKLQNTKEGNPLKSKYKKAYEYSDGWVHDARMVVLMASDAVKRGAKILTRNKVESLQRENSVWKIDTEQGRFYAKSIVNASGPWVEKIMCQTTNQKSKVHVRLVRGSHIITKKLFDHEKAYLLQGSDCRIIFAIPYEREFTLIGTTEVPHENADIEPECSNQEIEYLCKFASDYFEANIAPDDVIMTFSGVRPLYDDGAKSSTAATRDYLLNLNNDGAPILNVFGGKITTHRILAEEVLNKLSKYLTIGASWTKFSPLPGGEFKLTERETHFARLLADYPFLNETWAQRLFCSYGLDAWKVLGNACNIDDLGENFGADLTAREIDYLRANEFAKTSEDILWRRSQLGLRINKKAAQSIDIYMKIEK